MPRSFESIAFVASPALESQNARRELIGIYGETSIDEADVIVALGGDGLMLQTLHEVMSSQKPVYGMNRGSVGFLMNNYRTAGLKERIAVAVQNELHPLRMTVTGTDGSVSEALAINEVYLFRQSYQAAKLQVSIDDHVRLEELICDGLIIATPAGSTAYNLSAHGPILPLEAPLLAMTPVSAFRPRRWRGALLPDRVAVDIRILEPEKRPVNAVADNAEVKSVLHVRIAQSDTVIARILSDPDHSWSERILVEQFSD